MAGIHLPEESLDMATQTAETLARRRFTVTELEAMVAAGTLDEDERIELIGGEVVRMSPKGNHHEALRIALNTYWVKRIPDRFVLAPETTFRLTLDTYLEPDFVFFNETTAIEDLKADTAHLAVEIADSSYAYDMGPKAALYASFGVRELWVIHAVRLETRIHRRPSPQGYLDITDFGPDAKLVPDFAPELTVKLSALKLKPSARGGKEQRRAAAAAELAEQKPQAAGPSRGAKR